MGGVLWNATVNAITQANLDELDRVDDFGGDGGAFDQLHARAHGMRVERFAVVGPYINVDADHLAPGPGRVDHLTGFSRIAVVEQRQHRRAENQRAAVGDAGLDDEVGLDLPDEFLGGDDILRVLDDRTTEPREIIRILIAITFA